MTKAGSSSLPYFQFGKKKKKTRKEKHSFLDSEMVVVCILALYLLPHLPLLEINMCYFYPIIFFFNKIDVLKLILTWKPAFCFENVLVFFSSSQSECWVALASRRRVLALAGPVMFRLLCLRWAADPITCSLVMTSLSFWVFLVPGFYLENPFIKWSLLHGPAKSLLLRWGLHCWDLRYALWIYIWEIFWTK